MKHAAGIIGSKILNPRRKTKDHAFHINYLDQTVRRRLLGYARIRRLVSREVLNALNSFESLLGMWESGRPSREVSSLVKTENMSRGEVSADFGRLLGAGLYAGVMRNRIPADWIKKLFLCEFSETLPATGFLCDFVRVVNTLLLAGNKDARESRELNRSQKFPAAS